MATRIQAEAARPTEPAMPEVGQRARTVLAQITELLLPPQCATCHTRVSSAGHLCADCWRQLQFVAPPLCDRTGVPFAFDSGDMAVNPAVALRPPAYDQARSAVLFNDAARRLVHALKYHDRHDVVPLMGRLMLGAGEALLVPRSILVPVPLHPLRLWRRRFNQSMLLAQYIADNSGLRLFHEAVARVRHTPHQVGLTARQRRRNLAGAFALPAEAVGHLAGKHIIMIDDVLTTGATANALAGVLRKAEPASVRLLVFAQVATIIETPI